ncbi:MAG: hypothetical protein RLZZ262_445 [Bacteroidota bacterium]
MIQRIQSIYLLSAIAFMLICFFVSFGQVGGITIGMYHSVDAVGNTVDAPNYMVYIPLTIVLIIDTIALIAYKNRQRQMMLVRLTFILLAVVFALSTLTIMGVKDLATEEVFVPGMALISPFFAFICNYLALRAIRKDEELVRSVNRIR